MKRVKTGLNLMSNKSERVNRLPNVSNASVPGFVALFVGGKGYGVNLKTSNFLNYKCLKKYKFSINSTRNKFTNRNTNN